MCVLLLSYGPEASRAGFRQFQRICLADGSWSDCAATTQVSRALRREIVWSTHLYKVAVHVGELSGRDAGWASGSSFFAQGSQSQVDIFRECAKVCATRSSWNPSTATKVSFCDNVLLSRRCPETTTMLALMDVQAGIQDVNRRASVHVVVVVLNAEARSFACRRADDVTSDQAE